MILGIILILLGLFIVLVCYTVAFKSKKYDKLYDLLFDSFSIIELALALVVAGIVCIIV